MRQDRVALLIDADNVSLDVIDQAVAWVAKHYGGPHLRRAYCTPESAVKHQTAFKRLSVRPMVNLAAGKNSTDIALAVDAIEIAAHEQPDVIVIASSDSDFAPVVARLRERGCRVVGLGQQGKVGQETQGIYDDYEVFEHRGGSDDGAPAPRKRATRGGARGGARGVTRGGTSGASKRATKTEAPTKTATTAKPRVVDALAQAPEPEVSAAKAPVAEKPAAKAAKSARTSRAKVAPAPTTEVEDTAPEAAAPAKTRARKMAAKKTPARKTAIDDAAASMVAPPPEAAAPPAKKTRARKSTKAAATAKDDVGDADDFGREPAHEVEVAPTPAHPAARTAMADHRPIQPSDPSDRSGGTPRHVDLDAVLRALPELSKGTTLNLNDVGQRLRAAKLLSKSGSSIKLLRQFREIRLEPAGQPSRVRLV